MAFSRRAFLHSVGAAALATTGSPWSLGNADGGQKSLDRAIGLVTAAPVKGKYTILELPRILRDELDLRVIDLVSSSLASFEPKYLDQVRKAVDDAGCQITNLKMNQPNPDMNSPDPEARNRALAEYKRSLDAAARLGARWARPLPKRERPDLKTHVASYRELADYAAKRNIQMLVENYGWMAADPQSVVRLVEEVGRNIAACPDTGNWANNEIRYKGLALTFLKAVTCDFKVLKLGPEGQHEAYDLQRCFTIGWKAGFRGPWCIEHGHADRAAFIRELGLIRDLLRRWMRDA